MKRYSLTDTAKFIRSELKTAFPKTAFSVRSKSYSGGSSITVTWTDGPLTGDVNPLIKQFEGASFDGMQDLKTYNDAVPYKGELAEFAPDFVFSNRHESAALLFATAARLAKETNLPQLNLSPQGAWFSDGNYSADWTYFPDTDTLAHGGNGGYLNQLAYQIARNTRV